MPDVDQKRLVGLARVGLIGLLMTHGGSAASPAAGDLLPFYRYLNSPEFMAADVTGQWVPFFNSKIPSGRGRDRVALWEIRNLYMVAHIRRMTISNPGKRLLIVIGASHKPYFDTYLRQLMDVRVVQLSDLE